MLNSEKFFSARNFGSFRATFLARVGRPRGVPFFGPKIWVSTRTKRMTLSARKTAEKLGLTHTALLKAARAGRVTAEPDGAYDVEKLAKNMNQAKRRKTAAETKLETKGGNQRVGVSTPLPAEVSTGA
jgi:hypothetical protein